MISTGRVDETLNQTCLEKMASIQLASKDTAGKACPRCGETIVKENYLGGSIYYCRGCQILE